MVGDLVLSSAFVLALLACTTLQLLAVRRPLLARAELAPGVRRWLAVLKLLMGCSCAATLVASLLDVLDPWGHRVHLRLLPLLFFVALAVCSTAHTRLQRFGCLF